jgi:hypothetical protein
MTLLQSALISVLEFFYGLTGNYGPSLVLLSAFVSLSLAPLYHLTGILEKKERTIKQRLAMYKPSTHRNLNELYEQFGYWPFYSIRSLASLFIQIPILIAAYEALSDYEPLKSTWFGYPDNTFGLSLLPFAMTFINLCAVFISSEPKSKERKQGIFIAMVFFGLLYTSPAALLIYWTFNQIFTLARYLMVYPLPKIKRPGFDFGFAWQFLLALAIHCLLNAFLGEKQSIYTYVLSAMFAALIIYKFIAKAEIPFSIPNAKTIILNVSVMAFPAILIFKSNEVYFSEAELVIYIIALLLFSVLASFIFSPKFSVSLILSLMFLPMAREITYHTSDLRTSFTALFVVVLIFTSSVIRQKGAIIVFSLVASLYLLFFTEDENPNFKKSGLSGNKDKIPKELAELELKDSASIYLFMHDAFPHSDYSKFFSLPGYDSLMNIFEQHDFKIYDVYSMGYSTRVTMSSLLDMSADLLSKYNGVTTVKYDEIAKSPDFSVLHSNYLKDITHGDNIVNMLLQKNGYTTALLAPHIYDLGYNGNKFYDFIFYDKIGLAKDHENKIRNEMLKNILSGTLNSDLIQDSSFTSHLVSVAKFVRDNSEKSRIFMWGAGCPGHSTFGALGTTERELQKFLPIYDKCIASMKKEIEILKANPNAIIIFMSDHGPYFMDDGIGYKLPKSYDFNKTDYMKFRDIFGAFMAVRWPNMEKAEKYDGDFNVSQDLFPIVFSYLSDSEMPLKYKIKNTELRLGPHKFDKGVFYKNFYSEF